MIIAELSELSLRGPRPVFDLKWSLMWRVAVVALLCFLAGAAIALYRADQEAIEVNRSVGNTVGKHLELQLLRIDSALDVRERFPDADLCDVAGPLGRNTSPLGRGAKRKLFVTRNAILPRRGNNMSAWGNAP